MGLGVRGGEMMVVPEVAFLLWQLHCYWYCDRALLNFCFNERFQAR